MRAQLRKNVTRRSPSIPRKLAWEGAFHLLPLYYVLTLSDLGREGIHNSGSYRFADHIYAGVPSGRTRLGRWIDAQLLSMPAARAFRGRYQKAQAIVREALESAAGDVCPLRFLAVPCGIPRDMFELARTLHRENPALLQRIEYHAMDLDPAVLDLARTFMAESSMRMAGCHLGDALSATDYPDIAFHAIVSTGLGDFLDDAELQIFCRHVYQVLEPRGTFYTSGTARDRRSDVLLQMAELLPCYRTADQLERIFRSLPWSRLELAQDSTGLQTFVRAVK